MSRPKRYDGYQSFQYLDEGIDYQPIPLSKEFGRVPSHPVELDSEERRRAQQIMDNHTMFSLREHGYRIPEDTRRLFEYSRQGFTGFSYAGLAASGWDVIFDNFLDGLVVTTSKAGWKWTDILSNLGLCYADIAHQKMVYVAGTLEEVLAASRTGRIAVIPSLEAATPIENEIDRVDILYGFGIRCMGLTYNEANALGSGVGEKRDAGLTLFGIRVVKRMNKVGMIIDLAHCADETSMDAIRQSSRPVLITHSGARALWNTPRMKPDEVLMACAERGGLIGVMAAPNTTLTRERSGHTIDSVMAHFEYLVERVGIDHVSMGLDTMYGDHVALQKVYDRQLSLSQTHSGEIFDETEYVKGLENPNEALSNVLAWLIKHGYSDTEIVKVMGGNVLRVLRDIWY